MTLTPEQLAKSREDLLLSIKNSVDNRKIKTKVRPIRIDGDVAYIPLTKGHEAIIDVEDVPLVLWKNFRSSYSSGENWLYAKTTIIDDGVASDKYLHTIIMNTPPGMYIDHADRNGLNNRRSNLRVCTPSENQRNKGPHKNNKLGLKGVFYHKREKAFVAAIRINGKYKQLGLFKNPEDAYHAYCEAAKIHHGEFIRI